MSFSFLYMILRVLIKKYSFGISEVIFMVILFLDYVFFKKCIYNGGVFVDFMIN